jgi:GWxTD domain-containing protein
MTLSNTYLTGSITLCWFVLCPGLAAETPYQAWLREDAAYIITEPERQAFNLLKNDEERKQFIQQFWLRRDPTPETLRNEFKEEHYRRIAYANGHFNSSTPGWKTDRGRIYIMYGPPDEIESHPGDSRLYPFEAWRYRYVDNVGENVVIEFVLRAGAYRLVYEPSEIRALTRPFGSHEPPTEAPPVTEDFVVIYRRLPAANFKDLEELLTSKIPYDALPMHVQTSFSRLTDATVMVPVSIQFDGDNLNVKLYVQVTSTNHRVVDVEEDVIRVDKASQVYQTSLYLMTGKYQLDVAVKDLLSGRMNKYQTTLLLR